jgi:hypothetical protein
MELYLYSPLPHMLLWCGLGPIDLDMYRNFTADLLFVYTVKISTLKGESNENTKTTKICRYTWGDPEKPDWLRRALPNHN